MESNNIDFSNLSHREREYVLNLPKAKGNKSEAARLTGIPSTYAGQEAYKMEQKPEVQKAIEELNKRVGDISNLDIQEVVTKGLMDIALKSKADRDKLNALQLLGKTKAMFTDSYVEKHEIDNATLLEDFERKYGKEARDKLAIELGEE